MHFKYNFNTHLNIVFTPACPSKCSTWNRYLLDVVVSSMMLPGACYMYLVSEVSDGRVHFDAGLSMLNLSFSTGDAYMFL